MGSRTPVFTHNPVQQGSRSLFFTRRTLPGQTGWVPALYFLHTILSGRVPAAYFLQDGSIQQGSGTPFFITKMYPPRCLAGEFTLPRSIFTAQACPAGFRQCIAYRTGASSRVPALHVLQHKPVQQGSGSVFFTERERPTGFWHSIFYSTGLPSKVPAEYVIQDGSVQQGSGTPCLQHRPVQQSPAVYFIHVK